MVILNELDFAMTCQYHSEIHISHFSKIKNASDVLKCLCDVIAIFKPFLILLFPIALNDII